jgi:hypothetical protein
LMFQDISLLKRLNVDPTGGHEGNWVMIFLGQSKPHGGLKAQLRHHFLCSHWLWISVFNGHNFTSLLSFLFTLGLTYLSHWIFHTCLLTLLPHSDIPLKGWALKDMAVGPRRHYSSQSLPWETQFWHSNSLFGGYSMYHPQIPQTFARNPSFCVLCATFWGAGTKATFLISYSPSC